MGLMWDEGCGCDVGRDGPVALVNSWDKAIGNEVGIRGLVSGSCG